jgi:hypothetical protein
MKYIILFCIILFALPGFGQRGGEIVKDTIYFSTAVNECGDTVFMLTEIIELRGGRKFTNSQPVGFSENDPCSGVRYRDTATLLNAYVNPLIDYGRQQANKAKDFIFQNRSLKSFNSVDNALKAFGAPGLFKTVEIQFADSLVGNYILVRPGVANVTVPVVKTAQGAVRIRLAANSFLPITLYSDGWMTVRNVAGANQDVDLYQIEPGRWVSLLGNYQLVKSARQVVQKGGK